MPQWRIGEQVAMPAPSSGWWWPERAPDTVPLDMDLGRSSLDLCEVSAVSSTSTDGTGEML